MSEKRFSVHIGPRLTDANDGSHYDWTTQALNSPLLHGTASTTTTADLAAEAQNATLSVSNSIPFASAGGVWAKRSTGAYQYLAYGAKATGQLQNVYMRIGQPEQGPLLPSGTTIRQWVEVEHNDGVLNYTEYLSDERTDITYGFDLSGLVGEKNLFAAEHLVAIQIYDEVDARYELALVGVIKSYKETDDGLHRGEWRLSCETPLEMAFRDDIKPVRVGEWKLDGSSRAQADSHLVDSYFVTDISGNTNDSFEPGQALDGDKETMFVSGRRMGTDTAWVDTYGGIPNIFFAAPPGPWQRSRFIELYNSNAQDHQLWLYSPVADETYILYRSDPDGWFDEDLASAWGILGHDLEVFKELYPHLTYSAERDLSVSSSAANRYFFDRFEAAGGCLAIRELGDQVWSVRWGTQQSRPSAWDGSWSNEYVMPNAPIQVGNVLRWNNATSNYVQTPLIEPHHLTDPSDDDVWWYASLPELNLYVAEDLSSGTTVIPVVGEDGEPTTGGMPKATGKVAIDNVEYTISSVGGSSITLSSGLTAAVSEGEQIWFGITYAPPGLASDTFYCNSYPLKQTRIRRYGQSPYIDLANLRWSIDNDERTPEQSQHEPRYYVTLNDHAMTADTSIGHTTVPVDAAAGFRVGAFLMEILDMSSGFVHPRFNEVEFVVDDTFFTGDTAMLWQPDAESVQETLERVIDSTRLGAGVAYVDTQGGDVSGYIMEPGNLGRVLIDLAERGRAIVHCERDGRVRLAKYTPMSQDMSSIVADYQWDESEVRAVDIEHVKRAAPRQVKVNYIVESTEATGTEEYPASENPYGSIVEIGPVWVENSSEAAQIAQNIYTVMEYPYIVHIELAEGDWDVRSGLFANVTWPWSTEGELDRTVLLTTVNQYITDGVLVTGVSGVEVGRTSL